MALVYTSDELLESVKTSGMIPEAQSEGCSDDEILEHLSAVLQSQLALELMKIREEYYVASERTAIVSGTTEYRIPSRAMGQKLRDLLYAQSDGDKVALVPISRENLDEYNGVTASSEPSCYYFEGNYIKLLTSGGGGYLEFYYFMRPNDLVLLEDARQITSIATKTLNFASTVPTSWTASNTFDVHSNHSGAELKMWDATVSAVGASSVTMNDAVDGSVFGTHALEVGDWVCLAGESVVPALPRELHPVLVRGACLRLAEAYGDEKMMQYHGTLFQADLKRSLAVLESRVEGRPLRIKGDHALIWEQ